MMRGRLRLGLAVAVVILVQECVVPFVHIFGAYPDVVTGFVVAAGLTGGSQNGAVVGFVAGIAEDLFLQTPFGLSALVGTLVGFGAGSIQGVLSDEARISASIVTSVGSAVGIIAFELLGALLGQTAMLKASLGAAVGVVGIVNFILGVPLCALARWAGLAPVIETPRAPAA